jgi:hypothetical protein
MGDLIINEILPLSASFTSEIALPFMIPGPVVGAGLPGLLATCVGLLAWWRRRQKIA